MKQCHPTYNNLDDLEKGEKILNRRIETNTLTSQKERDLIREIKQIKDSRPFIIQKAKLQAEIDSLRQKQKKDSEELPAINKMLDSIKQRIEKVKGKTTAIEDTKVSYQDQLSQIEHKQTKIREQIAKLKADKLAAKEAYYSEMIVYEVEQKLQRDIMWLDKTKTAFLERKERNDKWKAE